MSSRRKAGWSRGIDEVRLHQVVEHVVHTWRRLRGMRLAAGGRGCGAAIRLRRSDSGRVGGGMAARAPKRVNTRSSQDSRFPGVCPHANACVGRNARSSGHRMRAASSVRRIARFSGPLPADVAYRGRFRRRARPGLGPAARCNVGSVRQPAHRFGPTTQHTTLGVTRARRGRDDSAAARGENCRPYQRVEHDLPTVGVCVACATPPVDIHGRPLVCKGFLSSLANQEKIADIHPAFWRDALRP